LVVVVVVVVVVVMMVVVDPQETDERWFVDQGSGVCAFQV